jgi:protein MpaA
MIVIAGALHGIEPNASDLVDYLLLNLMGISASVENDFTFYILPRLNPDGLVNGSRYNENGVDLNRNWATNNWRPNADGPSGTVPGSGGSSPFSEPETLAFSSFLLGLQEQSSQPIIVFNYHSAYPKTGLVQPSYWLESGTLVSDPAAYQLAQAFATELGYKFSSVWTGYEITGEAIHWCGDHGIVCMDIELPSSQNLTDTEKQDHLLAIMNVIR